MDGRLLNSWKEIATYLGRGVRTVQRWEDYGLPVKRPAGHPRSAVTAISADIDGWLQQRVNGNGHADIETMRARIQQLEAECAELRAQLAELSSAPPREAASIERRLRNPQAS